MADAESMPAMGHKRTFAVQNGMSALTPKADMCGATRHVCFVPKADIGSPYSITSSVTEPRRRHSETQGFRRPNLFPGGLRNVVIQK